MPEANGANGARQPKYPVVIDGAPTITLAGMEFPIPMLAIKQNRVVVPALLRLSGMLKSIGDAVAGQADPLWFTKIAISTEDFDLMCEIVVAGIQRATPGFSRGEFDQMPIALPDILNAVGTIAGQTGMMAQVKGTTTGETSGVASAPEAKPDAVAGEQPVMQAAPQTSTS